MSFVKHRKCPSWSKNLRNKSLKLKRDLKQLARSIISYTITFKAQGFTQQHPKKDINNDKKKSSFIFFLNFCRDFLNHK